MPKRKSFYDTLRSAARRLFVDLRKAAPTPTNIAKYEKRVRARPKTVYKYRVGYYDGKKVVPQPAKIYQRQPIVSKKKVPRRLVSQQVKVIDQKRVATEDWEQPSKTGKATQRLA